MSLLLSTQVTAVATAVLAAFAILTAVVAWMAFRKQAQEVTLLQVQLREQEELAERQAAVLELQTKELAGSVEERRINREQRHRAQAARVFIWHDRQFANIVIAYIKNASEQPIYDVEIAWYVGSTIYGTEPVEQPLMPGEQRNTNPNMSVASDKSVRDVEDIATLRAELWFRDAAGTSWRARPDGIVEEVPHGIEPPKPV